MFRVLKGLPPYGPQPNPFPMDREGRHRQGYVIEFEDSQGETWVGNFQKGCTSFSGVFSDFGRDNVLVIASGALYKINIDSRFCAEQTSINIEWCLAIPELKMLVLSDGFSFDALNKNGLIWTSKRISVDGIIDLDYSSGKITGKAYSPLDGRQYKFELDVTNGSCVGGSYNGP